MSLRNSITSFPMISEQSDKHKDIVSTMLGKVRDYVMSHKKLAFALVAIVVIFVIGGIFASKSNMIKSKFKNFQRRSDRTADFSIDKEVKKFLDRQDDMLRDAM